MLEAYRVLDLTDGRAAFAGYLLASLGAEVVLVEAGDPASGTRAEAPFIGDGRGPEDSLVHQSFNRGKKSVLADLTTDEGRTAFAELVGGADVVIESGTPSELSSLGRLRYDELSEINPAVVHGIVSPFGSAGPKADWRGTDLVVAAGGAQMSLTGEPGRAPLRTSVPQTWMHASADLAIGVLLSLQERARSGRGQQVDISAHHSWVEAGFHYPLFPAWGSGDAQRNGSHVQTGPVASTFDYPAKDGHITLTTLFGAAVGPFTQRFVDWMLSEGGCDAEWGEIDFTRYRPHTDIEQFNRLNKTIAAFTSTKTKAELVQAAWDHRLLIAPVQSLAEVLVEPQFVERGFYRALEIEGADDPVTIPGPYVHASPRPLRELDPAPSLGRDDTTLTRERSIDLGPPLVADAPADDPRPLAGVKVLDLTISFAGPIIGRILAANGATVVKVESEQRPDLTRTAAVFMNGDTVDHSGCFAHYNANKLSLGMNLRQDGATDVLFDMVRWADVLIDSFAPGALGRMGLDEATRAELNPNLITLSSSLLGQHGPLSGLAGYGNMAAALCGFFATTGWADSRPVGPVGAYTDIISPRFAVAAIVSALDHRRRTGEATNFDFGQGESCLHLLTMGMIDMQVNGRSWEQIGNDDHFMAPHGVYRAEGDDEWIAIAVTDDAEWGALASVIGCPELAGLGTDERLDRRRELDGHVESWTVGRDRRDMERLLQEHGIAAHGVQRGSDCAIDEQLIHRGARTTAPHDRIGELTIGTTPIKLSRTPATFEKAGPTVGQHSFEVLTELLGYDMDNVAELAAAEVLE